MSEAETEPLIAIYYAAPTLLAPTASPFVLKLLTYLRMTGLKYKSVHTLKMSSKGKHPFIVYKGKEIADSTLIIQFLNNEFNKDLNTSLNAVERATSLAFQRLCEENLVWCVVHDRWIVNTDAFLGQLEMSNMMKKFMSFYVSVRFRRVQQANLHGHGIGRHSDEEILQIGKRDLTALSNFLADKDFFMGSEPTLLDCTSFGLLEQIIECLPGSEYEQFIKEKLPNLVAYTERMKEKFWSDWKEQCAQKKAKHVNQPKSDKEGETLEKVKVEGQNGSGDAYAKSSEEEDATVQEKKTTGILPVTDS
ncbi:failed axon connections homolog [Clavelina lepadiformis]|uniref:failed axon connections homolog n=1 Tax=Clavelina lepadiformis TaxID=159417 RepID=UPI004041B874